jgi:nitroreductase
MINLTDTQLIDIFEHSQRCQRNWDLSKQIPEEHINLLIEAVKKAPSKQNIAYYKAHFITDRILIESITRQTMGTHINKWTEDANKYTGSNAQSLANLLIAFESYEDFTDPDIHRRNAEVHASFLNHPNNMYKIILNDDRHTAIGIASGYVALVANMLGYSTGFCACIQSENVGPLLNTNNRIVLLLGVGFPNEGVPHNVLHNDSPANRKYPSHSKQEILVNRIS